MQNQSRSSASNLPKKLDVKTREEDNETNALKKSSALIIENDSLKYIQEINRKTNELLLANSKKEIEDLELGLNILPNEENRGLITDMLGLPTNLKPPEILVSNFASSSSPSTSADKISSFKEKELLNLKKNDELLRENVIATLEEIQKICNDDDETIKINNIETLILKLKEQLVQMKDKRTEQLVEMIAQKDAKLRLYDSRIRILQVKQFNFCFHFYFKILCLISIIEEVRKPEKIRDLVDLKYQKIVKF